MRLRSAVVRACTLALALSACGRETQDDDSSDKTAPLPPAMGALRQGVETQMIALLRDIATAQERAQVERGHYVDWNELTHTYYPDPIPKNLHVRMVLMGDRAYEVEVSHEPSGMRCGMSKGTTASLYGAPRCR
jgi:hypothetical protein